MHERSHPRRGGCIFFNICFDELNFWIVNFEDNIVIFQVHDSATQFSQANAKKTRFNFYLLFSLNRFSPYYETIIFSIDLTYDKLNNGYLRNRARKLLFKP
jgi:hypothetical protein